MSGRDGSSPAKSAFDNASNEAAQTWVEGEGLEPGDAYLEGPYVVFTAQFHLRRGYCCNSDCRHCPYREPTASDT